MVECCRGSCTKARAIFNLGLLECFFFSGFLVGYPFISQTLEAEGYFASDDCTRHLPICPNITTATGASPTPPTAGAPSRIFLSDGGTGNRTLLSVKEPTPPNHIDLDLLSSTTQSRPSPVVPYDYAAAAAGSPHHVIVDCVGYNLTGNGFSPEAEVNVSLRVAPCAGGQRRTLRWVHMVSLLVTGLLAAPLGLLYDMFGTLKTRIIPIVLFITTTLLITFSSKEEPWLLFIAIPAAGVSGFLLLLTNLQVSNLLRHRVTALLLYHMAHDGAAIIMLLVQLSARAGLNIQSSFMFLTGGVIPLLICTIAFLPKRQIPWPLPENYKEMKDSIRMYVHKNCQAQMRKKAAHRRLLRLSVATSGLSCLYVAHVMWYALMMLRIRAVEFRDQSWCNTNNLNGDVTHSYVSPEPYCIYNATYPCAALLVLLIGLALDRRLREQIDTEDKKQNLILWCYAVIFVLLTLLNIVMSGFLMTSYSWSSHVISTIHVVLRITVPGTSASFIFTVLPCRHFGQNYGASLALVALTQALVLYPLDVLQTQTQSVLTVNIVGICLGGLCLFYPLYLFIYRHSIEFNVKAKEQDIMLCPAGSMCKTDRTKGKPFSQEECQTMVESAF